MYILRNFLDRFLTAKPRTRPILGDDLPKNTSAKIGENATMSCRVVVSGTLPDFRWLKWDKSVTYVSKIEDNLKSNGSFKLIDPRYYRSLPLEDEYGSEVTIFNVTEDDFGLYTCYASNHIGAEYNSAFLIRKVKPATPGKKLVFNYFSKNQPKVSECRRDRFKRSCSNAVLCVLKFRVMEGHNSRDQTAFYAFCSLLMLATYMHV